MNYQKYLQSAQWKRVKDAAIVRANNTCQICSSGERLEVHHNTYAHVGNEYDYEVIALCHECHQFLRSRMVTPPAYIWEPDQDAIDAARELAAEKRAERLKELKRIWGKNGVKRKENDALFIKS